MFTRALDLSLLAAAISMGGWCAGQSFVNPGFESGTTGWSGCPLEINSQSVYGGSGSNKVAEVDGHTNAASTADDRQLCQTLTGFTVGSVYILEFQASRRVSPSTPASVSVTVRMDNALNAVVTRTGGWNLAREQLVFVATLTTHTLHITPNFTTSFGMLFDNFNISVASPLPVELLHFDAQAVNNGVRVDWATGSEQNNAGFAVERSTDLIGWERVAYLPGAGNSQRTIDYQVMDERPLRGTSYYRLGQIDTDGREEYSAVKHVYVETAGSELSIWPNPATTVLHLRMDDPARVEVLNTLGQRMPLEQRQGQGLVELGIGHLPPGQYTVRGGSGRTARFIKE
ncbi:MAG: hypothetical protein R2818_10105 [Flavobacteriales bacterium]